MYQSIKYIKLKIKELNKKNSRKKNLPTTHGNKGILNISVNADLDFTKSYYVQYAGVNRDMGNGLFRHYFGISAVGTVGLNAVVIGLSQGSAFTETSVMLTGLVRFSLFDKNGKNVGNVDLDTDKMMQGNYYQSGGSWGILRQSVFDNYSADTSIDVNMIDNYPLDKGDDYVAKSGNKGILNLVITATVNTDTRHYIKYAGVNRNMGNGLYRHYFGISAVIGGTTTAAIAPSNTTYMETTELLTGVHRLKLYNSIGEAGYMDIDADMMRQGSFYQSDGTFAILRQSVFMGAETNSAGSPTANTHRLLLPDDAYFLDNNPLPIYQRFCVSSENNLDAMKFYVGRIDGDFPFLKRVNENIQLIPSDFDTSLGIAAKYGTNYNDEITGYFKDLTVHKVNSADLVGKTATIIGGGDSIFDYDISGYINKKFTDKGIILSFQGTLSDTISGVVTKNEGRASWEYRQVVGKMTKRAGGDGGGVPIIPQPNGNTSDLNKNPFISIATPEQLAAHPEWCFENTAALTGTGGKDNELNYTESQAIGTYTGDYYTLNMIDYIANHDIVVGDKLIFLSNWGFNDLNHWGGSEAVILDALMAMGILATRLREYADANPTKTVILGISPLLVVQIYNKWTQFSSYLERAIKKIKALNAGLQSANFSVKIVPVWMSVDQSWAWSYPSSGSNVYELNDDNDSKYCKPNDTLHPGTFGKNQISNIPMYFIANNL